MITQSARRRRLHRTVNHPKPWLLAYALALALAGNAQADAVTDWNATAGAVAPRFGGPQQQTRAMAIVQIAVHDALNSVRPRYNSYTSVPAAHASASPEAAVASAARGALLGLLDTVPPSTPRTEAIAAVVSAYDAAIAAIPDGAPRTNGITAGATAASAILSLRSSDGSATPHLPYTLAPGPGIYQPTPNPEFPAVIVPAFAGWANVTPFAIHRTSQFFVAPGRIFDLTSRAYAREYNEVKFIGDALRRAAEPDSEESDIARFWPGGGSNWNLTTRVIVDGLGLDMWQHARLFALLNIAEADALIANQKFKYMYNFWRPVTAIRWADDGNPHTSSDPMWRPFLVTPPYPDYPCALPSGTGASTSVLREFFGTDDVAFVRTFNAGPVPLPAPLLPLPSKPITRHFDSLSEAALEAADARVFGGLHFRSGCIAGNRHGTQIGKFVFKHTLEPRRPGRPPQN